jgi:hypothetical protein
MMVRTYKALLRGNRLEWLEEAPEAQTDHPLSVQVTILEQGTVAEEVSRGQAMAALLEAACIPGDTIRRGRPREVATRTSPGSTTSGTREMMSGNVRRRVCVLGA